MFHRAAFLFCRFLWSFKRAHFYRDLADALRRKVAVRDFLVTQAANARMLKDYEDVAVYKAMSGRLEEGNGGTYAELLRGICPLSDQLLLAAIDDAGQKQEDAFQMCANAVEFQLRTLKTVAFNLVVPLIAIVLSAVMCGVVSEIVVAIAKDAPAGVWTGFNGFVRALAEGIYAHGVTISVVVVASIVSVGVLLPRWYGATRLRLESWPAFGLYRDFNASIVLSSMALMIQAGKTMREALDAIRITARPWLRWHLGRIIRSLEDNPTDYISAFGGGLMPPSVRGRLASLLNSSASFSDALVTLGTSEIGRLEKRVEHSSVAMSYSLSVAALSLCLVLSIGVSTIASALAREADPNRLLLEKYRKS